MISQNLAALGSAKVLRRISSSSKSRARLPSHREIPKVIHLGPGESRIVAVWKHISSFEPDSSHLQIQLTKSHAAHFDLQREHRGLRQTAILLQSQINTLQQQLIDTHNIVIDKDREIKSVKADLQQMERDWKLKLMQANLLAKDSQRNLNILTQQHSQLMEKFIEKSQELNLQTKTIETLKKAHQDAFFDLQQSVQVFIQYFYSQKRVEKSTKIVPGQTVSRSEQKERVGKNMIQTFIAASQSSVSPEPAMDDWEAALNLGGFTSFEKAPGLTVADLHTCTQLSESKTFSEPKEEVYYGELTEEDLNGIPTGGWITDPTPIPTISPEDMDDRFRQNITESKERDARKGREACRDFEEDAVKLKESESDVRLDEFLKVSIEAGDPAFLDMNKRSEVIAHRLNPAVEHDELRILQLEKIQAAQQQSPETIRRWESKHDSEQAQNLKKGVDVLTETTRQLRAETVEDVNVLKQVVNTLRREKEEMMKRADEVVRERDALLRKNLQQKILLEREVKPVDVAKEWFSQKPLEKTKQGMNIFPFVVKKDDFGFFSTHSTPRSTSDSNPKTPHSKPWQREEQMRIQTEETRLRDEARQIILRRRMANAQEWQKYAPLLRPLLSENAKLHRKIWFTRFVPSGESATLQAVALASKMKVNSARSLGFKALYDELVKENARLKQVVGEGSLFKRMWKWSGLFAMALVETPKDEDDSVICSKQFAVSPLVWNPNEEIPIADTEKVSHQSKFKRLIPPWTLKREFHSSTSQNARLADSFVEDDVDDYPVASFLSSFHIPKKEMEESWTEIQSDLEAVNSILRRFHVDTWTHLPELSGVSEALHVLSREIDFHVGPIVPVEDLDGRLNFLKGMDVEMDRLARVLQARMHAISALQSDECFRDIVDECIMEVDLWQSRMHVWPMVAAQEKCQIIAQLKSTIFIATRQYLELKEKLVESDLPTRLAVVQILEGLAEKVKHCNLLLHQMGQGLLVETIESPVLFTPSSPSTTMDDLSFSLISHTSS
jgi:hypothetical protein